MSKTAFGIDFGTTNSTVGLAVRGQTPKLLAVEGAHVTIPSALFFSLEDGNTYFGREAVFEYMDGAEGRFMRALKSILGTSLMKETTQVGRTRMSFEMLIGRFLQRLRESIEREHGQIPDAVVLGRPVRFVDEDDAADATAQNQLEAAARVEGFAHVEFQFEPVAAALHYERQIAAEELALVVDIGGGTSDFSVLRLSPERATRLDRSDDILSTSGVHVGGTDFDRLFNIAKVMPEFGLGSGTKDGKRALPVWYFNDMATWHRINTLYTAKNMRDIQSLAREAAEPEKLERYAHLLANRSGHRLAAAVETAKIALTDAESTEISLSEPGLTLDIPATRAEFENATAELVTRIDASIDDAILTAGVDAEDISTVILTGGGALVPAVRMAAERKLKGARISHADQFGAVGLGLAIDAARRFG
ncbi:Hsp70 family protein [Aliihoeflea sp. PC F10.4]